MPPPTATRAGSTAITRFIRWELSFRIRALIMASSLGSDGAASNTCPAVTGRPRTWEPLAARPMPLTASSSVGRAGRSTPTSLGSTRLYPISPEAPWAPLQDPASCDNGRGQTRPQVEVNRRVVARQGTPTGLGRGRRFDVGGHPHGDAKSSLDRAAKGYVLPARYGRRQLDPVFVRDADASRHPRRPGGCHGRAGRAAIRGRDPAGSGRRRHPRQPRLKASARRRQCPSRSHTARAILVPPKSIPRTTSNEPPDPSSHGPWHPDMNVT